MVTVHGYATTGNGQHGPGIPLPHVPAGPRPAHRPWCTDCKRAHDPVQIDDTGRCPKCGPMAERRAAAAERRRLADEADSKTATSKPPAKKAAKPRTAARTNAEDESPDELTTPVQPVMPAQARQYRVRLLDTHRAEVIRRYAAGQTAKTLGEAYGVTPQTVINYLRAQGVPVRGRGGHPVKTGATA